MVEELEDTLMNPIGIVLANIGTPIAPTVKAVRKYLNEFLSDPRVIALPKLLWQPILKGIILPTRSRSSAKLYQKIWTDQGSPLLTISQAQAEHLQQRLQARHPQIEFKTVIGMSYGEPSIAKALTQLKEFYVEKIIVLPLFPQYSATTTAATFDAITHVLQRWRYLPDIKFINHYYNDANYINAIVTSVQQHWQQQGRNKHLVFSFHGIPKAYIDAGDPYASHCHKTANLIAESLQLNTGDWSLAFQSRFGPKEWLQPYCVDLLQQLPQQGIDSIDILCPGFAADCLETLEEIAKTNREIFLKAGGKHYHYIPALNTSKAHISCLEEIIGENL